jgi:nucleoporin GLE1
LLKKKQQEDALRILREAEEQKRLAEIARQKAEEEKRRKEEEEKRRKLAELQKQKAQQPPVQPTVQPTAQPPKQPTAGPVPTERPTTNQSQGGRFTINVPTEGFLTSVPAYVEAQRRLTALDQVNAQIQQQCTDPNIKKTLLRTMNKFSGRINNSLPSMGKLIMDVVNFLLSMQQQSPQYLDCAFITLSEKLIAQMESTGYRDNYKSVFPAGILVVEVAAQYPRFMELILAMLHRKSKFTIPLVATPLPNESKVAYRLRLGYTATDNNLESENDFEDRMKGLLAFYAAITQTNDLGNQVRNPHGPENAWRWVASVLNMQPPQPIAVEMLAVFLGVSFITWFSLISRLLLTSYIKFITNNLERLCNILGSCTCLE